MYGGFALRKYICVDLLRLAADNYRRRYALAMTLKELMMYVPIQVYLKKDYIHKNVVH